MGSGISIDTFPSISLCTLTNTLLYIILCSSSALVQLTLHVGKVEPSEEGTPGIRPAVILSQHPHEPPPVMSRVGGYLVPDVFDLATEYRQLVVSPKHGLPDVESSGS